MRLWIALLAWCLAAVAAHLLPAAAEAHGIYVTSRGTDSVSVIDSRANAPVGSPIGLAAGTRPIAVAIAPDGARAYVSADNLDAVFTIDTRSNRVVAPPIGIQNPASIAIAPDGKVAYVIEEVAQNGVSTIDTATNQVFGPPIEVPGVPDDVAVTPDGRRIYVSGDATVSVIDVGTRATVATIPLEIGTENVVISPDGTRAYVTNFLGRDVTVIDTRTNQVLGAPIPVGLDPDKLAISPNGRSIYVSSAGSDSVSAIDTGTNQVTATILVGDRPEGIAVSPDGKAAYVANEGSGTVSVIDTGTNRVVGAPIPVGDIPVGLAIVPNQAPVSSLSSPIERVRPGVPTRFDATASRDPDGSIASFAWSLAGAAPFAAGPVIDHTFPSPGTYDVSLTLTDDEGCSTTQIFTGRTAHCNGSSAATKTMAVEVAYPGVRVRCPAKAKPRCRFSLQVVTKKRKGKAMSKVAKASAKRGKAAIVSLRPTARYTERLAGAKRVLVKQTLRVGKTKRTTYRRLTIVQ